VDSGSTADRPETWQERQARDLKSQ
jgi:hypothetical protein